MIARLLKLMLATGAGLLVTGALIIIGTLYTSAGSVKLLKQLVAAVPELEIDYREGTLNQGIELTRVRWRASNGSHVTAKDVSATWNMVCWSQKAICLGPTTIGTLTLHTAVESAATRPGTPLPAVSIAVPIEARSVTIKRLEIHAGGAAPVVLRNARVGLYWIDNQIKFSSFAMQWDGLQIGGSGTLSLHDDYPLDARLNLATDSSATRTPLLATARLQGSVKALDINLQSRLPFDSRWSGSIHPFDRDAPLRRVKVRWSDATWASAHQPAIHSDSGQLELSGSFQRLAVSGEASLRRRQWPDARIELTGTLKPTGLTIDSGTLHALGGSLQSNGSINWHDSLSWSSQIQLTNLMPSLHWPLPITAVNGNALFVGQLQRGKLQFSLANLTTTMAFDGTPVRIDGSVGQDAQGSWHLGQLTASSAQGWASIDGVLGQQSRADAQLNINVEPFLPEARGNVSGALRISGNRDKPNVQGTLQAKQLDYRGTSLIDANAQIAIADGGRAGSAITVRAAQLSRLGRELKNLQADIDGSRSSHRLRIHAADGTVGELTLELAGQMSTAADWHGTVQRISATPESRQVSNAGPIGVRYHIDRQQLTMAPHCWSLDAASLCINEPAVVGTAGRVSFQTDEVDLTPFSSLLPANIRMAGKVGARGRLEWNHTNAPQLTLDSSIRAGTVTIADPAGNAPLSFDIAQGNLNVTTQDGIVSIQTQLNSTQLGRISGHAKVNSQLQNYPVSGTARVSNASLRWLQRYAPELRQLQGRVGGTATLSGDLATPVFSSQLKLTDGRFQHARLPLAVDNIGAAIHFDSSRITFNGNAIANQAPVAFSGTAGLGAQTLLLDSRLAIDKLPVSGEYLQNGVVNANLAVQVSSSEVITTGDVELVSGTIVLGDDLATGLSHSPDVVIVEEIAAASKPEKSAISVKSIVDVQLGGNVRFRGLGLNARLTGALQAHLSDDDPPQVAGEINIDNGTYRSYGQDLVIRNGTIHFIGPPGQAALSAEAIRQIDGIAAGMRLEGSIQSPTATLFSEPALPEEEILSYLVLGRPLDDRSDAQAQVLANAALYVSLRNGQLLSDKIATIFGIDDFYVTAAGTGQNTQLLVSGRLSNRLLLRYGVGIFNPVNTLYLRYDLAERLYVETTRGLERAVDFYYSFEF